MENFDTYYKLLTPEQKRAVIDIAKLVPYMPIGRVAKIFIQSGGSADALKLCLLTNYPVKYGGDRI